MRSSRNLLKIFEMLDAINNAIQNR